MTQYAKAAADGLGRTAPFVRGGGSTAWRRGKLAGLTACLMTAALLLGCSTAPKPPPPTVVELTVQPDAGLNPDPNGRPSPVVMRLYHLASKTAFETADFFQLYENDAAVLGPDLLGRNEVVVLPGQAQTLSRELKPDVRFLGVAVFFRKFDEAEWRALAPVPPNQTTPMTLSLGPLSVSLAPGSGTPDSEDPDSGESQP